MKTNALTDSVSSIVLPTGFFRRSLLDTQSVDPEDLRLCPTGSACLPLHKTSETPLAYQMHGISEFHSASTSDARRY